jgi:hypothetical protein
LDAKRLGSQWVISAAAVGSGVSVQTVEGDQHAATAGTSAIYKICPRKAPLSL